MLAGFISAALKSEGLMLANRIAPLVSAGILMNYFLQGRTIGIVTLSEDAQMVVKTRTGKDLSPSSNWRAYFWGETK